MDLFSFLEQTDGLDKSLEFAMKYGLLPDKNPHTCIKCGRVKGLRWTKNSRVVNIPFMFVCAQKECRSTVTISRNTLFHQITFSLSQALRLIYFWLMKISTKECANQLKLTDDTVNEWFQFFREMCAFVIINYTKAVGGPGHVVDICDYQFQSTEVSGDKWLFTGVDRNTGENFAIHIEDLGSDTLWPIMKNYIMPGTIVVTERFREFNEIEDQAENQSLNFVHPKKKPRSEDHYSLDELWNQLNGYVEQATPPIHLICKELYAYEFLYFNRDGLCNKPASELIIPFMKDIKLVYPGFEKMKHVEYKTVTLD